MASFRPGVAAEKTLNTEPEAFEDAPFLDGFDHVLRAGRVVAAGGRKHRGNDFLINADGEDENIF